MTKQNLRFSFNFGNMKTIPFDKYEKNFTFIVNEKPYETSRYVADIFSPIVRQYHYNDETINEFYINTKKKFDQNKDNFQDFLRLINEEEIELNEEQRALYSEYFLMLGNIEEYFLLEPLEIEKLSIENVIDRLLIIQKIQQFSEHIENKNIQQIIDFASEHFYEIPPDQFKMLGKFLIEEIIKNENLRIETEDSLMMFIIELYEKDHKYSNLFEYIDFNNLSRDALNEFIDRFNIDHMNRGLFRSICESIQTENNDKKRLKFEGRYKTSKYIEFEYKKGDEFNGIMKYLSSLTNGNIHDNGTIQITTNSIGSGDPKNLVDYQSDSEFRFSNKSSPNSELCFDFKDTQVQLTSYSIKSYGWSVNDDHLKSWILEVSDDGKKWEKIDEHSNDQSLNGPNYIGTFNTKQTNSFYRFVRLTQTGPCFSGDYHSSFVMFEFYGKLIVPKSTHN